MMEAVIASKNEGKVREILEIMTGLPIRLLTSADVRDWPDIEESGRTYVENALLKAVAVSKATGLPALADDSGLEVDALDGRPGVLSARFAGPNATDEDNNIRLASLLYGVPPERRRARYRCAALLWIPRGAGSFGSTAVGPGSSVSRPGSQGSGAPDSPTPQRPAGPEPLPGPPNSADKSDEPKGPSGTGEAPGTMLVEIDVCEGWIATEPKGKGGFGYDPWFIPQGESTRMAELTDEEKNRISHRGKAFRGLRRQIQSHLDEF